MYRLNLSLVFLIYAMFVGRSDFAQGDACLHRTIPVTVVDSASRPVQTLAAGDFQGKFRGKPVEILGVTRDIHPRRILILLDVSGSMLENEDEKWRMVLEIAGDAVANLPANVQIALSIFDEKIEDTLGFSTGRRDIAEKIIALKSGTKAVRSKNRTTALWDSLSNAISIFGPSGSGDSVYLISDGGDNRSKIGPRQAQEAFLHMGIRLFSFLLISRSYLGYLMPDEQEGLKALKEFTAATGGAYTVLATGGKTGRSVFVLGKDVKEAVARQALHIYVQMLERSWVEINLPVSVDKPREWTLELNRSKGAGFKDFELLYPHDLLPCSAPPYAN